MRSRFSHGLGLFAFGILVNPGWAQTELFRFPNMRGVSVAPQNPLPAANNRPIYPQPAVNRAGYPPVTPGYHVPVAPATPTTTYSPIAPAPDAIPSVPVYPSPMGTTPMWGAPVAAPVTVAAPPTIANTTLPAQPLVEFATEWTPVAPADITTFSLPMTEPPSTTIHSQTPSVTYPQATSSRALEAAQPTTVLFESTTSYRPVVTTYDPVLISSRPVTATPVPVGRNVVVRPKVYIQGQPIRNFFRAVTP